LRARPNNRPNLDARYAKLVESRRNARQIMSVSNSELATEKVKSTSNLCSEVSGARNVHV